MKFRLKAFGLHLLGSACVLTLVLGGLFLGWYRWPGWYLADVGPIALILAGVDVSLGPLLTFVIANPNKPLRELARDVSIIALVQLVALGYGVSTLWNGRVLYYTYSDRWFEIVQASDLDPNETALARAQNPRFAPYWNSLPRWVYAPLPSDSQAASKIMASSITGGNDVIQMPRYFKPWDQRGSSLRKGLKAIDSYGEFSLAEKTRLKQRLAALGLPVDQANTVVMMGRGGHKLLAVVDPATLAITRLVRPD